MEDRARRPKQSLVCRLAGCSDPEPYLDYETREEQALGRRRFQAGKAIQRVESPHP
jgi:hypothetical protein